MTRFGLTTLLASLSLVFGAQVAANAVAVLSPFPHEAVQVHMPTGWHVAAKFADKGMFLLQVLPDGADEKNPHTLINIATYLNTKALGSAKDFADREQKSAPNLGTKGKVDFRFTDESNPNDVTYELTTLGVPQFPDQFEVHRVLKGKDGVHAIIYHVEPATQTPAQVAAMHELLKNAKLVEPPKAGTKSTK